MVQVRKGYGSLQLLFPQGLEPHSTFTPPLLTAERACFVPLQWPWGASADRKWRDLGVQQPVGVDRAWNAAGRLLRALACTMLSVKMNVNGIKKDAFNEHALNMHCHLGSCPSTHMNKAKGRPRGCAEVIPN